MKPPVIAKRRARQGKTNYNKRLYLLKSGKPLLVVRFSNTSIQAQVFTFDTKGDVCHAGINSSALEKFGWTSSKKNIPAAYLTGYMLAKKVLAKGVSQAILHKGYRKSHKGGKLYAFLKGAIDAGLDVPADESVMPTQKRIDGEHISKSIKELAQKTRQAIESTKW